nr:VP7 [Rotavirus A]
MYGIEYTQILFTLISILFILNLLIRLLTKLSSYLIMLIIILLCLFPFCFAQNYGINRPITGNMDVPEQNSTQEIIALTSTLCIYYPNEIETQLNDQNWKQTIAQLFAAKGWPIGSVNLIGYENIIVFSNNPQLYCDYNVILVKYAADNELDVSEFAELVLNEWLCNEMQVTLYYYQQVKPDDRWIAMGTDCTVKVCPLNAQTLGIGCETPNEATFEEVATQEKLAIIDVVNGVNHKVSITNQTCTIKNCKKLGPRENVAILQIGGPNTLDIDPNPTNTPDPLRVLRINWKKWWQVFYTIVDYINTIVTVMSKRSRSLNAAAYYYRV